MSNYRTYHGVEFAPLDDGRGHETPMPKVLAGLIIGKKWREYAAQGVEIRDPWIPMLESAKEMVPENLFKVSEWTEEHFHDWVMEPKGVITWGAAACSKAVLETEPVYTAEGPVRIGDLSVGDEVMSATGRPARVVAVHDQTDRPLYRVRFVDGTETVCAENHLWTVRMWRRIGWDGPRKSRKGVSGWTVATVPVERMASWRNLKRYRVSVPLTRPVEFRASDVPVDPYVLGCLVGDGCVKGTVTLTNRDETVVDDVRNAVERDFPGYTLKRVGGEGITYMAVRSDGRRGVANPVISALRGLGLYGKTSYGKFVPDAYRLNSVDVRMDFLAGLFDTDGTVSRNGLVSFTTASGRLADDVRFMLESVGAYVTVRVRKPHYTGNGVRVSCSDAYSVIVRGLPYDMKRRLFRLERKRSRIRPFAVKADGWKQVESVVPVSDRSAYPSGTRCITIAPTDDAGNPTGGLFPVGHFTVTHNSNDTGLLLCLDYYVDPFDTVSLLGSTTRDALKSRSWNSIVTYHNVIKENGKDGRFGFYVPGIISRSGFALINEKDLGIAEAEGDKAGIQGRALEQGGTLQGAHAKYVRLVVDELATIKNHDSINVAIKNLRVGATSFKFIGLANPASWDDPSCQYCIPEGGVSSVSVDTGSWRSTRGYFVRHHDGLKSPCILHPELASEFPFLITKEVADANLQDCDGNEDAPDYWQMVRGFPVPTNVGTPVVLDPRVANDMRVTERPVGAGAPLAVAAGVDPAWSDGGDGAVYQRVTLRESEGKTILDFSDGMTKLAIRATSDVPVTQQLRDQVFSLMSNPGSYNASLDATAVDSSANQGLADDLDIYIGQGAASCIHVNNAVRASENPIRQVGYGASDTQDRHIETCRDRYYDRGTEAWCVLAEFCKAGMVRGLPAEALRALTTRRFAVRKGSSTAMVPLRLEPKDEFRARFRKSPDECDACALAALAVKERFGVLPYGWFRPASAPVVGEPAENPAPFVRVAVPTGNRYNTQSDGRETFNSDEGGETPW